MTHSPEEVLIDYCVSLSVGSLCYLLQVAVHDLRLARDVLEPYGVAWEERGTLEMAGMGQQFATAIIESLIDELPIDCRQILRQETPDRDVENEDIVVEKIKTRVIAELRKIKK